jgi:hypothetical protein
MVELFKNESMNPIQIYYVTANKVLQIEESNCFFTSDFKNIQEAKEMMVARIPDLLVYQIDEYREIQAIFHFLKALKQQVPTVILYENEFSFSCNELKQIGVIECINLSDSNVECRLNQLILEIVPNCCRNNQITDNLDQTTKTLIST